MTYVYALMLCHFVLGQSQPVECNGQPGGAYQPGATPRFFYSAGDCDDHHRRFGNPSAEDAYFRKTGWKWVCVQKKVPAWELSPAR
jgi:hypothetical protein